MAMYYMNSKTFLKEFINLNPTDVLDTQYVLVSNSITKNGKFKNVVTGSLLYPSSTILCRLEDDDDREEFEEEYMEQLKNTDAFLSVLIKGAIEEKYTIVFLCSKFEAKKLDYFKILAKYIRKRFGYPLYCYEDMQDSSKRKHVDYNKERVLKICNKIQEEAKRRKYREQLKTVEGRKEILAGMSKEDMKKELKKRGLYYDNMSKRDMKDTLKLFFVEE